MSILLFILFALNFSILSFNNNSPPGDKIKYRNYIIPILNCFRIGIILINLYLSDKSSLAYLFSKIPVYCITYLECL